MHFSASLLVALSLAALPFAGAAETDPGLNQAMNQVLYRLEPTGPGAYRAVNRAQRLSVDFTAAGARLQHPDGSVTLHVLGYGYGEHLRISAPVPPVASKDRVEYRRADLTEWYKNDASGLEQGFTLSKRPGNPGRADPLVIAMGADSELSPELTPEGDAVLLGQVMRYGGLRSWDARGRTLPSRLEVGEHEIRIVVDDRDAEYPLVIDPTWVQQQKLVAPDGAANDFFGLAVSVSGDTALIGAPQQPTSESTGPGAAYVFVRSGTTWTFQQKLNGLDQTPGDYFGVSVSLSGDTALVGEGNLIGTPVQGAAYVFVRSGTTWTQQQKLVAMDGAVGVFGYSVSLSGDTAVIGAPRKNSDRGSAYVFVRTGTTWTQQQAITASDAVANNGLFGLSVSVNLDTAVIGAFGSAGPFAGVPAYVFVRASGVWSQQQELHGNPEGGELPQSVAVDGDTAVLGTDIDAYVYFRTGGTTSGTWTLQQDLSVRGTSVAVSGDTIVTAAGFDIPPTVFVFKRNGATWTRTQQLTGSDSSGSDRFGTAVSVNGSTILVGDGEKMVNSNAFQGAAYVFVPQVVNAVSVTPNSGTGLSQTFTAVYSDTAGATDLQVVYLDIDGGIGVAHSCFVAYVQFTNQLYLFNDTNSGVLGPLTPGSGSVSNSQCTLSGAGSGLIALMGSNLTVAFNIAFQPGYMGAKNIYGLAQSYDGTSSGSVLLGTWMDTHPMLAAVSVSPINGSGAGPQTFSALYTDSAGASDVQAVYLLFGGSQANACFVAYVPFGNALYLFNDADTGVVGGSSITAGTSATLTNSQCTLSGAGGTATLAGNNFTAPFNITFQTTFTGTHNVYGFVQSYDGTLSAVTLLGTWTLP